MFRWMDRPNYRKAYLLESIYGKLNFNWFINKTI